MKKLYILFILAGAFLSACSDFLEKAPITSPESGGYLASEEHLTSYVNFLYTGLPTLETYGMGVFGEEKNSDNILAQNYERRLNGELQESNGGSKEWEKGYKGLRDANYCLHNYAVPEMNETDKILSLKGEVYFFRAYWHFYLLTRFGSIPIMDDLWDEHATAQGLQVPATDRGKVAKFILEDLDTAKKLLYPRSKYKGLRVSQEAALILAMRVALYEGSWEKYHAGTDFAAATNASTEFFQTVITLGDELFTKGLKLNKKENDPFNAKDGGEAFAHLFNKYDLSDISEAVFWKKYSISGGLTHGLSALLSQGTVDNSGPAGLSQSLVDNYLYDTGLPIDPADDKFKDFNRTFEGRDLRLIQTVMHSDCRFKADSDSKPMKVEIRTDENKDEVVPPYLLAGDNQRSITGYHIRLGLDPLFNKDKKGGETALPIIRYAEALLAYAEAAAELGNGTCEASILEKTLQPLRERAGVTYVAPTEIDPNYPVFSDQYTLTPILQEIRRERRAELALQGFRLDDLMRWRAGKLIQNQRGKGAYLGKEGVLYRAFSTDQADELDKITLTADKWMDPLAEWLPAGYQFNTDRDYLLPIPLNEINLNEQLHQNPGWRK